MTPLFVVKEYETIWKPSLISTVTWEELWWVASGKTLHHQLQRKRIDSAIPEESASLRQINHFCCNFFISNRQLTQLSYASGELSSHINKCCADDTCSRRTDRQTDRFAFHYNCTERMNFYIIHCFLVAWRLRDMGTNWQAWAVSSMSPQQIWTWCLSPCLCRTNNDGLLLMLLTGHPRGLPLFLVLD